MNRALVGIYMIMNELNSFSIKKLEDRIFLQKAIYIIQVLGIDLRFRFSWYIYGPYSKELTHAAYDLDNNAELQKKADKLTIKKEAKKKIDLLKQLLEKRPHDLDKSHWFELLSSIHYIKHISLNGCSDEKEIEGILKKQKKKRFDESKFDSYFNEAWQSLKEVNLIDNKKID